MTYVEWCRQHFGSQADVPAMLEVAWLWGQAVMRERAALVAEAHICGCGDHATEAGRRIRALEAK